MLIIFDVDGTLIGGEPADWHSFDWAIHSVLGIAKEAKFFESAGEVTARAIVKGALAWAKREPEDGLEAQIREEYFKGLRGAHAADPQAFQARKGAKALLKRLKSHPGVEVAIATGDWLPTILFKLGVAGIDVSGYPVATASDCFSRAEIIALAAKRAGRPLSEAVYVGDGPWDFRACQTLGIPFIGTGERAHVLREAGARHLHPEFEEESFLETIRILKGGLPRSQLPPSDKGHA